MSVSASNYCVCECQITIGCLNLLRWIHFFAPPPQVLVTIATNMILSYNENILQGKGLNMFFLHLMPNLEWSDAHMASFSALLSKIFRLFKHLQKNTNVRGRGPPLGGPMLIVGPL